MSRAPIAVAVVLLAATARLAAAEDPAAVVTPTSAHAGDPVLVTVPAAAGAEAPTGKAGGQPLEFARTTAGYQAVYAVALDINEDHVLVEFAKPHVAPITVTIAPTKFAETKLVVEDELANPGPEDRKRIDADNGAIGASYAKANGPAQWKHPFKRPAGTVTGTFGEWRTFNDGHRSQHLGLDIGAREGSKVVAVTDGTVSYVGETLLAGNVVVVAHGAGISSLYFHLQKATVAVGDVVTAGQALGLAGHTGRTTGPHLHVSIHAANGMVDPDAFFKLKIASGSGS